MTVEVPVAGRSYFVDVKVQCKEQGIMHEYAVFVRRLQFVFHSIDDTIKGDHKLAGVLSNGHKAFFAAYELKEVTDG